MDQPRNNGGRGGGGRGRGRSRNRGRGGRGRGGGGGGGGRGGGRGGNNNNNGRNRGPKRHGSFSDDDGLPHKRQETPRDNGDVAMMDSSAHSSAGAPPPPALITGHAGKTEDPSFMTKQTFASLPNNAVSSDTTRAVTDVMKLARLTEIQLKTLVAVGYLPPSVLEGEEQNQQAVGKPHPAGVDVLGRARTGTGKTVSFLMPALQTVLNGLGKPRAGGPSVKILCISPTRELATQISVQAEALLTYHKPKLRLSSQVVYGGTNMKKDVRLFERQLPTILIATPGRLKDHLENTTLSSGRPFVDCMNGLQVLVLDEADQLLEMGFRPDITRIISYLPPIEKRQTLLFSATMPKDLKAVMAQAMKRDFVTVDCIHDKGAETNIHVEQSHVVLPSMDRLLIGVVEVVLEAMRREPVNHKVIVFFSTAKLTAFYSDLFNKGMNIPVIEIHSRKSQTHRDRASEKFRNSKRAVLFSSDVSARGVDYPDVTHVIQIGLPDNREQYIHRLGRTGRAGRAGKGWLVLAPFERSFLKELKSVNCLEDSELKALFAASPNQASLNAWNHCWKKINDGDRELVQSAEGAYRAMLGFYNTNTKRIGKISKAELVQLMNEWSRLTGLRQIPSLQKRTVGKMGLKGVPGLVIE